MISAVIVHMGQKYPEYLSNCIEQFFLFNKDTKLHCIVEYDFEQLNDLSNKFQNLNIVKTCSLTKTKEHKFFLTFNRLTRSTWRGGFWRYVVERFFTLYDFMETYNIENILHFEYDNLIYCDIKTISSQFEKKKDLCIICDSDERCIPGVVFIPQKDNLKSFCKFYNRNYTLFPNNDMVAFSKYSKKNQMCTFLPVIPPEYLEEKKILKSQIGKTSKNPNMFCKEFSNFNYLFDAAAFGQYIGGIDKRNDDNQNSNEHFINEEALYDPSVFQFIWKMDSDNLKKPYLIFKNKEFLLFNLHIHSKNLKKFMSN